MVASAIHVFAASGYLGTPITAVAEHAGISPAYVFKLFPGKKQLFVAALDRCFELIREALADGAEAASSAGAEDVLDAMGGAYADLIGDRDLLMLQVHALSAADVPEIREAMRRGTAGITRFATARSGGSARQVQRFLATGQLCHLVTMLELDQVDQSWARTLDLGIRHADPALSGETGEGMD